MSTISDAIRDYLESVEMARSQHTAKAYANGLRYFTHALRVNGIQPDEASVADLQEDAITWLCRVLKDLSPATEQLYTAAAVGFYEYLVAERIVSLNLPRVRLLVKKHNRRAGTRIPQYPRKEIEQLLEHIISMEIQPPMLNGGIRAFHKQLIPMRDKALLLTLADTGLRIHEACNLRTCDLDFENNNAIVIGKGDRQAKVYFSSRAIDAIRDYLDARSPLDCMLNGSRHRAPIFARHDRGAGWNVQAITTAAGRYIVSEWACVIIGDRNAISPHKFRHHFITNVYKKSGGNLILAKELARHASQSTTQRYTHLDANELEASYREIFERC